MMPGFAIFQGSTPLVVIDVGVGTPASTGGLSTDPTTFTFTSFGPAAGTRLVFLCYTGQHDETVSGVTIGGVTATKADGIINTGASPDLVAEIWWALVPTNADVTAVVDYSGVPVSPDAGCCSAFAVYGAHQTAPIHDTDKATDTDTDVAATVDIPARGGLIACAVSTSTTFSWTNATEVTDTAFDLFGGQHSTARRTESTATSAVTVTATLLASRNSALVVCTISPLA